MYTTALHTVQGASSSAEAAHATNDSFSAQAGYIYLIEASTPSVITGVSTGLLVTAEVNLVLYSAIVSKVQLLVITSLSLNE